MKAVLISIQPKWCEKIIKGEKTVEIRKTRPKLETPFKCYIYCTLSGSNEFFKEDCQGDIAEWNRSKMALKKGMVIGEFVCDEIREYYPINIDNPINKLYGDEIEKDSCLSTKQVNDYAWRTLGYGILYGWHISNFVMYDEPKELSEFYRKCNALHCEECKHLKYKRVNAEEHDYDCEYFGRMIPLKRPPQSWCYVQEG